MSITELETLASRLHNLTRDAIEFGQSRLMVLDLIDELADELQEQANDIAEAMAAEYDRQALEHEYNQQFA